ncbi:hercules receptor kinase 2 [Tasmannia lanceolata]|uniref:hercules receptor kinase 2 n=1 Tax=Tasmannia lanceolata TaxID=3420 RepID=UPI004062FEFF
MEVLGVIYVIFMSVFIGIGEAQIKPLLIDCGTNSSINVDGRRWVGDLSSDNNLTLSSPGMVASTATLSGDSIYGNLYKTARIFTEVSNYSFRVDPGKYFVRLHFFPFPFDNLNVNESSFDVTANNLKLVSKFSVTSEIFRKDSYLQRLGNNSTVSALVKEYFLSASSNELLIKFIPNDKSFAFVNAIEVIPVLKDLIMDSVNKVHGNGGNVSLNLSEQGIETMYRLNVGGLEIRPDQDQELWRKWESDARYMFTADASTMRSNSSNISYASANDSLIAPLLVYETARTMMDIQVMDTRFNMSWKFDIDPDFEYLVRLHFCELFYDKPNQRNFRIYINNHTAAENFDVFLRAGGKNKAYHQDYADEVSQQIDTLWIQLGPDTSAGALGTDALLNGLEIFKVSRNGNLASVSERFGSLGNTTSGKNSKRPVLWVAVGASIVLIAILSTLCTAIFCFRNRRRKSVPDKNQPAGMRPLFLHGTVESTTDAQASKFPANVNWSMATTRTGRRFTIAEIRTATKNFDESLVIGTGGFGKVYKGEIDDGTLVAIKRAHPQSEQGLVEFETEIQMLSKLRHRHLVSMIGYCEEKKEMILVYEYMENGTLRNHLFGSDLPPLSWKQRLDVCIGAARGLHYLHTGSDGGIIHRDVKTTNILLDENFVAKMADFGLSKTGPEFDRTHVSTAVKGSFGYLDPEYFRRQQLTDKSDVYSFGVVLFEVVCARSVINPTLPKDQINLAEWAIQWQRKGSLETIMDPQLKGNCSLESLKKYGEIAGKCLADEGKNRPTMGEVLWHLEYVLQLQEASTRGNDGDSFVRTEVRFTTMPSLPRIVEGENGSSMNISSVEESLVESKPEEGGSAARTGSEDALGIVDFSQLVNPQGR